MNDSLILEKKDQVLVLTINRPNALNAINGEVMQALHEVFVDQVEDLDDVRAIVLHGAGEKAFAAGADITEFPNFQSAQGAELSLKGHTVYNAIENFDIPVIAMVQGYALGGGCELAMACHIRIAQDCARFGQPEINLGVVPGYGGSQRLVRYIGRSRAMKLLLTGEMIDANAAEMMGLVSKVVPSGQGMEAAMKMASKIASKSPLVTKMLIELVNAYGENGFDMEIEYFGACFDTADLKEGVAAFMEKRKPNFTGN